MGDHSLSAMRPKSPPHYPYKYVKKLPVYACDTCTKDGTPGTCTHTTQSYTLYFFGPKGRDDATIKKIKGLKDARSVRSILDGDEYGVIMVNERSIVGSIEWSILTEGSVEIDFVQIEPRWFGRRLCTPMVTYLLRRCRDVLNVNRAHLFLDADKPTAAAHCYLHSGQNTGALVEWHSPNGWVEFTDRVAKEGRNKLSIRYTWPPSACCC